jgi:hypothetical protein
MIKLSKNNVDIAKSFIMNRGRPLEQALCRYHFDDGPKKQVLLELGKFQNSDGGFGNALEPDLRASESSVLCTSFALDILTELDISYSEMIIENSINYLMRTYDEKKHVWRFIPETTDTSPHAPWWNQDGLEKTFGNFLENPRVKICGNLFHYKELTPQDFRNDILKRVLDHMETREDMVSGDTLKCYLHLSQCRNLPCDAIVHLEHKLKDMIPASVETDSTKWEEYCLKPIGTIKSPNSQYLHLIDQAFELSLDYEIRNQDEDGSWKPFWSWGGVYPEDWKAAKQEWSAILTLDVLKVLEAFGRMEK